MAIVKRLALCLLFALELVCCVKHQASADLFDPNKWFNPSSWSSPTTWPFIPVPEVATDPVGGTTIGLLTVFLETDANHQITRIFAPDLNYNTIVGPGGTLRYLAYPSSDVQWFGIAGGQRADAAHAEFDYASGMTHQDWWSFEGHFLFQRDPTYRFLGLGNESNFASQTNYAFEQLYLETIFDLNITSQWQLALAVEPWFVRIGHGALPALPFTGDVFPTLDGLGGGSLVRTRLFLAYDTRNSLQIPTRGGLFSLFVGGADKSFLSSFTYAEYGVDVRRYVALTKWLIAAFQLYARYLPTGSDVPFWVMSWLGGDGSGESSLLALPLSDSVTWRGYGAGRFIDPNVFAGSVELRTRVYERDLFDTHGILELAPFFDFGQVFQGVWDNPVSNLHPAGGMGFRALALPYVVGYVDIGYSANGMQFFSGVNYPF